MSRAGTSNRCERNTTERVLSLTQMQPFSSPKQRALNALCAIVTTVLLGLPTIAQNAETPNASWCATPEMIGALTAQNVRSYHGKVTDFNSKTNVLKLDVEYSITLADKTSKSQIKSVNVVLTPRTILQKVCAEQVASAKDTATKFTIQPLQRTELKVGQSAAFSFTSPFETAASPRSTDVAQPPTQVEATAVYVREQAVLTE